MVLSKRMGMGAWYSGYVFDACDGFSSACRFIPPSISELSERLSDDRAFLNQTGGLNQNTDYDEQGDQFILMCFDPPG